MLLIHSQVLPLVGLLLEYQLTLKSALTLPAACCHCSHDVATTHCSYCLLCNRMLPNFLCFQCQPNVLFRNANLILLPMWYQLHLANLQKLGKWYHLLYHYNINQWSQFCFLAHLVMSLCNHALSIMCHCHHCCWYWCWHWLYWCWCWHLCTAVSVTALIIETPYHKIYASMCLVYAHEIFDQCNIYILNGSHFNNFIFCGSSIYMVKLRAFIFDSVMHLYWSYL